MRGRDVLFYPPHKQRYNARLIIITMKRRLLYSLLAILLCTNAGPVNAQNLQFHYDLGRYLYPEAQKERPTITATIEQQSIDRFGDTFYFVDMSFLQQGAVSANWKFMRNLRFWQAPVAWHVRYDGGIRFVNAPQSNAAISMNDAFMTGASYTYLRGDRRLMLSAALLYKYIHLTPQPHNFELCTVWKYAPGDGLFSATGFISFWQQVDKRPGWNTRFKLMMQPQFWCNLNKLEAIPNDINLSIGSEIRISRNVDAPQWIVAPTLALKWSFR